MRELEFQVRKFRRLGAMGFGFIIKLALGGCCSIDEAYASLGCLLK